LPDGKHNSYLVSKFINLVMQHGKKNLARTIVYDLLEELEKETKEEKNGLQIFEECLDKARPSVVLKARRVGGSNIQVPIPVEREKGLIIAMRWVLSSARGRKGTAISKSLHKEFADIVSDQGDVLKKKDDTLKMAESSRAFAHFK
jgi:small subunit ribosomal protein S7